MLQLKRSALVAFALVGAAALSACGVSDKLETPEATPVTTQLGTSSFTPSVTLLKAGIPDGVYTFRVEPARAQTLLMGTSLLQIPANGICKLGSSGYGGDFWNRPCESERRPLTITVVSSGSSTDHPRVDFSPELRFSPSTTVMLYMYGKGVTAADASLWVMYYCGPITCVNEALKDASLTTYVDVRTSVVYRRIKHFSGYFLAE